jgi:hypothetical protein
MHGEKYGIALKTIPLSNNTVMQRIESMSEDNKEQLLTRINCELLTVARRKASLFIEYYGCSHDEQSAWLAKVIAINEPKSRNLVRVMLHLDASALSSTSWTKLTERGGFVKRP